MLLPVGSEQLSEEWVIRDSLISLTECYFNSRSQDVSVVIDTVSLGLFSDGNYLLEFDAHFSDRNDDCNIINSLKTSTLFDVGRAFEFEDNTYANINILPNPTRDGITRISHAKLVKSIEVFAPNGQIVWSHSGVVDFCIEMNLLTIPATEYRVRITMKDNSVIFRRLVRTL